MSSSNDPSDLVADLLSQALTSGDAGDYEGSLQLLDRVLTQLRGASEPNRRLQLATALFRRGWVLQLMNDHELAIAAFDELIDMSGERPADALTATVARAMYRKAFSLAALRRFDEANRAGVELVERLGDVDDPAVSELVAVAWINASRALADGTDSEQLLAQLGAGSDPIDLALLGRAVIAQADGLLDAARPADAVELADAVLTRLEHRVERLLRQAYALALATKAVALGRLGDGEESARVFEEMVDGHAADALGAFDGEAASLSDAATPRARRRLAWVLSGKAMVLASLERQPETRAVADEMLQRFASDDDPVIAQAVALARQLAEQ